MSAELKRHQIRHPQAAAAAAAAAAENEAGEDHGTRGVFSGDVNSAGAGGIRRDGIEDELPPWVTSSEVMSPLLAAYDARIQVRFCQSSCFLNKNDHVHVL